MQDIAVIPCALLATVVAQDDGSAGSVALSLGKALLLAALAAPALYVVFTFVVPKVLHIGSVHASRELSVLTAIVSALGAVLLARKAGLAPRARCLHRGHVACRVTLCGAGARRRIGPSGPYS